MNQLSLSLDRGRALKREGQQRAAEHAGSEWSAMILKALRLWLNVIKAQGRNEFRFEEFRATCTKAMQPVSSKAWGALPRMAVRDGLIMATGKYAQATSEKTHAHPVMVWRVADNGLMSRPATKD